MASLFLSFLALTSTASAASSDVWRDRSIYQLMTDRYARSDGSTSASCATDFQGYCGGTWQGITNHLDYIQDMGFDAIWISPITQQIDDPTRGYTGYMQSNLYGTNAKFGTSEDLSALSSALHSRGMFLMVDVVANHFGANGPASSLDYSAMVPFNDPSYFNDLCWISNDDNASHDENMIVCWIGNEQDPCPDLNTTQPGVRSTYQSWIQGLVSNYSIDGIRIDSVKNVESDFWGPFQSAASVYAVGEVSDGSVDFVCPYQSSSSAQSLDGVLNYPMYYQATQFFQTPDNTSSAFISTMQAMNASCADITLLGAFTENHDQPRFAWYTDDMALAQNVLTYTIMGDGIPIVYAGQEQHYRGDGNSSRDATWLSGYSTSAPLVSVVTNLNKARRAAINAGGYSESRAQWFYYDDHNVGIAKGEGNTRVVYVLSNEGSGSRQVPLDLGTAHGFAQGTQLTEVLSCSDVTVGDSGDLRVALAAGVPQVFLAADALAGSGLCGN